MKAILGTAAVIAVTTLTLMRAIGADAPSRPPGVSANEWAPISDNMGVVLVDQQLSAGDAPIVTPQRESAAPTRASSAGGGAALVSPISGYLMVRRGTLWQRLIVIDPLKGPGVAG